MILSIDQQLATTGNRMINRLQWFSKNLSCVFFNNRASIDWTKWFHYLTLTTYPPSTQHINLEPMKSEEFICKSTPNLLNKPLRINSWQINYEDKRSFISKINSWQTNYQKDKISFVSKFSHQSAKVSLPLSVIPKFVILVYNIFRIHYKSLFINGNAQSQMFKSFRMHRQFLTPTNKSIT